MCSSLGVVLHQDARARRRSRRRAGTRAAACPCPRSSSSASPRSLASCALRISAGRTWLDSQIEVVAGAVEVGRHRRDEVAAVLPAVGLAQLDAGDLGDRVPLVGRLERPGQQRVLGDRLRRELRVDAGRAEEQQLLDAALPGGVDDVGLDHQVVVEELGRVGVVGEDAADLGGGDEHGLRPASRHPALDRGLPRQVDLGARSAVRISQPSRASRRTSAAPTMPRWPATQTRLPSERVDRLTRDGPVVAPLLLRRRPARSAATISATSSAKLVLWRPAELVARLGGIAQQLVDLGRAEVARIDRARASSPVRCVDAHLVDALAAPRDARGRRRAKARSTNSRTECASPVAST